MVETGFISHFRLFGKAPWLSVGHLDGGNVKLATSYRGGDPA